MATSTRCAQCGEEHEGLPTDYGFQLPDDVHALSYIDRYRRAHFNKAVCVLNGERHFVRGLLYVPFVHRADAFAWGVWAEVSREAHDAYVEHFDDDALLGAKRPGRMANTLQGFPDATGSLLEVEFRDHRSRPMLRFPKDLHHPLAQDQHRGIDATRHVEYAKWCGCDPHRSH